MATCILRVDGLSTDPLVDASHNLSYGPFFETAIGYPVLA